MSDAENPRRLRVVYLEDDLDDRFLVARAMHNDGFDCEFVYATSENEFRETLNHREPDLILSDFTLPGFNGAVALLVANSIRPEVPFIFVSGTIGEERAVDALKCGATDYVLKDRLQRLGAAVRRALREARERAERRRAEAALRQSEEDLRAMFEVASIGMAQADVRSGQWLRVNQKMCANTGYSAEELLRMRVSDITHPEDRQRDWGLFQSVVRGEAPEYRIEKRYVRKDGSVAWVNVNMTVLRDAAGQPTRTMAAIEDITERKLAQEALALSEERFRELAETIQEVFWVTDPTKNVMLYISPAYEKIWGRSRQSIYDEPRSWLDAIHPEDRERILEAVLTRQANGTYDEEYRIVRPDGQLRWIRDLAFPVHDANGRIKRVVGVARDITERREMEQQFRQAQKMEGIGQLAGGIAHDFNNLLAVMRGNADLLLMDAKQNPPQTNECLQHIAAAAERAAVLTRQLLIFGRKQTMQSEPLMLNGLVNNLTRMLKRVICEDIRFECRYAEQLPFVQADPCMLEQVLLNLVVNARDAMPRGGQLLITTEAVSLDAACGESNAEARAGQFVCLTVSDTGTGIAPEHLERIFEPFFTTKEPGKGTGLGLATVYGIVKQHQGWVKVTSRVGEGTTFKIFLPAIPPPEEAAAVPAEAKLLEGSETILLVEDDYSVRLAVRRVLEKFKYKVHEATCAREAAQVWADHGNKIALLLTDMVMPNEVTGRQLVEQFRAQRPELKVVFMSGYSAEVLGKNAEFFRRTGSCFLQKPCDAATLIQTVRHCLDSECEAQAC